MAAILNISPPRAGRKALAQLSLEAPDLPPQGHRLVLGSFQSTVTVDLGSVSVGTPREEILHIEYPSQGVRDHFSVSVDTSKESGCLRVDFASLCLERGQTHDAKLTYMASDVGKFREVLKLKMDGRFTVPVVILGEAIGGCAKRGKENEVVANRDDRKRRKRSQLYSFVRSNTEGKGDENYENRNASLTKGAASLTFRPGQPGKSCSTGDSSTTARRTHSVIRKKGRGSGTRNPLPSTSRLLSKSLVDKSWAEKQAAGFTKWLNYVLVEQHAEGETAAATGDGSGGCKTGGTVSPLRDVYTLRRNARLRQAAWKLFHSKPLLEVQSVVRARINEGNIALRLDRVLHADVGMSANLVDLMLSYHPRWLHLGMETIFGEMILVHGSGGGGQRAELRRFVRERVIQDPDTKAKYAPVSLMASGESEKKYNEELAKHTLFTVLVLVHFLDTAKREDVLPHGVCLFRASSEVKSSEQMLKALCGFLHGEGDFVRHLNSFGYAVSHKQIYVDEVDYRVTNLAVDLRDGIKLCRLVDVLTHGPEAPLTLRLRAPAVSRLQKLFNVDLALGRLRQGGILTSVGCKDVVDGNQLKTLQLLWQIIARHQLASLFDVDALIAEISAITAAWEWRTAVGVDRESVLPMPCPVGNTGGDHPAVEIIDLLLNWAQAICHGFGVPVDNFTTSFADGRALCLLIHYYHPEVLPLRKMRKTTAHLPHSSAAATAAAAAAEGAPAGSWGVDGAVDDKACKLALEGEHANVWLASKCLKELGGVPLLLEGFDSVKPPEERSMATLVAFLCSRLVEASSEIRAAIRLQRAFRRRLRAKGMGDVVSRQILPFLCDAATPPRPVAVRSEQSVVVPFADMSTSHETFSFTQPEIVAAGNLQRWWSRVSGRPSHRRARRGVTLLQAQVRGVKARLLVARVLQERRRARQREEAAERDEAALAIQSAVRCLLARRRLGEMMARRRAETELLEVNVKEALVTCLSAMWRGWQARKQYSLARQQTKAMVIQRALRGHHARVALAERKAQRELLELDVKEALVTSLSAIWRGRQARKRCSLARQEMKAVVIQSALRGYQARVALARRRAERRAEKTEAAALTIQSAVRCWLARRQLGALTFAREQMKAVVIQSALRQHRARAALDRRRAERRAERSEAALTIQSAVRCLLARRQLGELIYARQEMKAVVIQSALRQHRARAALDRRRAERRAERVEAALTIQSAVRCLIARRRLGELIFARQETKAVVIQTVVRRHRARVVSAERRAERRAERNEAALAIQSAVRCLLARRRLGELIYARQEMKAVVIQSALRQHRARAALDRRRAERRAERSEAALTIQSALRCLIARRRLGELIFARQETKAVVIQTVVRRHRARVVSAERRAERRAERSEAALAIQSAVRCLLARRRLGALIFARQEMKAVVIQSALRQHHARAALDRRRAERRAERSEAALTVQSAARCLLARRRLGALIFAREQMKAVVIQSALRQHRARAALDRRRAERRAERSEAALTIQSAVRCLLARRRLGELIFARQEMKAVVIQTVVRRHRARVVSAERRAERRAERNEAALAIQSAVRCLLARRRLGALIFARQEMKAVVIQSALRQHHARAALDRRRAERRAERSEAALAIQSAVRCLLARRRLGELIFARQETKAVVIQSALRQHHARAALDRRRAERRAEKTEAALTIQSAVRCLLARRRLGALIYAREQMKAVVIQSALRQHRARAALDRRRAERRAERSEAALAIQSAVRCLLARRRLGELTFARQETKAVVIQSALRQHRARAALDRRRAERRAERSEAALAIQSAVRCLLARRRLGELIFARQETKAVVIQSALRQHHARAALDRRRADRRAERSEAALTIQSAVRCLLARRRLGELTFARQETKAVVIQTIVRRHRARVVSAERRAERELLKVNVKISLVTSLAAIWRGWQARKCATAEVSAARARLAQAAARAGLNGCETLGARVQSALWTLQHAKQLTHIMRACLTLELSSRYSPICCQVLALSDAPKVMYALVRTLNRSPPHQKILRYILLTIRNVARHHSDFLSVVENPSEVCDMYVDLLQVYRDKPEVFLLVTTLLYHMVSCNVDVRRICQSPAMLQRCKGVEVALEHRVTAEVKRAAAAAWGGGGAGGRTSLDRAKKSLRATHQLVVVLNQFI